MNETTTLFPPIDRRVSIRRCSDYCDDMTTAMAALLEPLGGLGAFVRRGMRVLVKPNLVTDRDPAEAATTHPSIVRALIRLLKREGCVPVVGDSPFSAVAFERVWERTGMARVCREENVENVRMESGAPEPIEQDGFRFALAQSALEADAIVNVPKLKTHVLTTLTCGVKNLYGLAPGFQKAELHKRYARIEDFCALLRSIERRVRPALTVVDGVVGMHGDGPTNGEPFPFGMLLAGPSAVVVDRAVAHIVRLPVEAVPFLNADDPVPLFSGDPAPSLPPLRIPRRKLLHRFPAWTRALVGPLFKVYPIFSPDCIRCGRCVKGCPVTALTLDGAARRPRLKYSRCIGCCCCHEGCPVHAVSMKATRLMRLITGETRGSA